MTDAIELLRRDHDEVRALLSELDLLDGLDPEAPQFEPLLRQLTGIGRAHHEFEERRV